MSELRFKLWDVLQNVLVLLAACCAVSQTENMKIEMAQKACEARNPTVSGLKRVQGDLLQMSGSLFSFLSFARVMV